MSDIKIQCVDQSLTLTETPSIYSGDINTDRIIFTFSNHWNGYTKTAVVYRSEEEVYQLLLDDKNSCFIPKEVLSRDGNICIGVYGVKGNQALTSQVLRYRIRNGAISDQLVIDNPTLTIYEQIVSQYGEISNQYGNMIDSQNEYQREWSEKVDQSIQDAKNVTKQCWDAIAGLQYDETDMNGGDPWTDSTEYEFDVNGGYPFN